MFYRTLKRISLLAIYFITPASYSEESFSPQLTDFNTPILTFDRSPVCQSLLNASITNFLSNTEVFYLPPDPTDKHSFHQLLPKLDSYGEDQKPHPYQLGDGDWVFNGQPIYIQQRIHNRYNERLEYQYIISAQRWLEYPKTEEETFIQQQIFEKAPPHHLKGGNTVWVSDTNDIIYVTQSGTTIDFYQLNHQIVFEKACSVSIDVRPIEDSPFYIEANNDRSELMKAINSTHFNQGSNCSKTYFDRHPEIGSIHDAYFYYPWRILNHSSAGPYTLEHLEQWSLKGVEERNLYLTVLMQIEKAEISLSNFFKHHFNLSPADAQIQAEKTIEAIVYLSYRFSPNPFYDLDPHFQKIATTLFEHGNLNSLSEQYLKEVAELFNKNGWGETPLNIAVNHPDSLRALLDAGFNPNSPNDFGKTPLMYAIQQNNIKAVKLLLEAGALVNVGTYSVKNCDYDITSNNLTALHYATRYASSEIILTLLEYGAEPMLAAFIEKKREYPSDWLVKYNSPESEENNPNISDDETNHLLSLLTKQETLKKANEYIAAGENAYQNKQFEIALNYFILATNLEPENARAWNDLAITSHKLGMPTRAIAASFKVTESRKSNNSHKASAYYNLGLICSSIQKSQVRNFPSTPKHIGLSCSDSSNIFWYYLEAFQLKPTNPRAQAIIDFISQNPYLTPNFNCTIDADNTLSKGILFLKRNRFHLLLKGAENEIPITVSAKYKTEDTNYTPSNVSTFMLKDDYYLKTIQFDSSFTHSDTITFNGVGITCANNY